MFTKEKGAAGFTLIELMVTLALVGLVIAGGFSLYFFADRSFVSGTVIADVQADIQLAMQRITNELQLAHTISFEEPAESDENLHHLLVNDDGLVELHTSRGSQILTLASGSSRLRYPLKQSIWNAILLKLSSPRRMKKLL